MHYLEEPLKKKVRLAFWGTCVLAGLMLLGLTGCDSQETVGVAPRLGSASDDVGPVKPPQVSYKPKVNLKEANKAGVHEEARELQKIQKIRKQTAKSQVEPPLKKGIRREISKPPKVQPVDTQHDTNIKPVEPPLKENEDSKLDPRKVIPNL